MTRIIPKNTDVLVVGAGPTGLMLANQLARRGVSLIIIDRHVGPSIETRALGVQARTVEIYAKLGIAERALDLGRLASGAELWANGRLSARVPLGDIGRGLSPYPFLLILGQDDNERLLGEALGARGAAVHWNTELVALQQNADGALATLKLPDGSRREIAARWVAGCDGAHSAVRTLNGIAFPGAPYEHVFFVTDTVATGPMAPGELNVYLLPDGFHLFFPMRGENHWRVVGILPPEQRGREDVDFDEIVPSIRGHVGPSLAFQDCRWFSTYRIHHRHAERFRDRRCFLLGDAAHIHSPVGAQGMNTGLQDAYNLAWKLALVLSGQAAEALLDSYEAERLPVARRLLRTTDRAFSAIVSEGWLGRIFRTRVMARAVAFAMRFEKARRLAFLTISQIGIRYRRSPLSVTAGRFLAGAPRAGDRFPWVKLRFSEKGPVEDLFAKLDDRRFHLIVFGQRVSFAPPAGIGDLLIIHEIPDGAENDRELARARIPKPSFYLLRPDGHVGLAGIRFEAAMLSDYFSERIGLGSETDRLHP